ncbi:hypothetical protein LTR08_001605 [Meristemomyces frigidus]|nr:hypothetical protein LTR08_001605 [Meristemomyces frigidus]
MLKSIFYARFHPERGPSVIHQYPNGSIVPAPGPESNDPPLLRYSDVSAYIIPPYELCDRPLSICTHGYRVLGFPLSIEDEHYDRNRFTFNVCFVLDETEDVRAWEQVVKKTAAFFRGMEVEDALLQSEEDLTGLKLAGEDCYPADDVGVVYSLLQSIFKDITAYRETCVRVSDFHVLNLRLTVPRPAPPKVHAWDVPLLIRSLPNPEEWTWDLTLQRIHQHIDGVKSIQRIAELADVELQLVQRAVRELLYHDRIVLLDIFHFQAIYAPTTDLAYFVKDAEMLEECRRYVATSQTESELSTSQPSSATLITLYAALGPGVLLYDFVLAHAAQLTRIDIRRLITFGVIKGFLRRIHKYALAISTPSSTRSKSQVSGASSASPTAAKSKPKSSEAAAREIDRAWKKAALSSGWATPPSAAKAPIAVMARSGSGDEGEEAGSEARERLMGFLDGKHCMDEICVAMRMSERKVVERVKGKGWGEVVLFNK